MNKITVEHVNLRNIGNEMISLHAQHFISPDSELKRGSYIDWLLDNPNEGSIYLAAFVDGKFASFLGFMARGVVGFGRDYRGALAFGAMTKPEFSGRGLYRRLAIEGWKEVHRQGFDFAMGYTTRRHVLQMERRMGWVEVEAAPVLMLPVECEAALKSAIPKLGPISIIARPYDKLAGRWTKIRLRTVVKKSTLNFDSVTSFLGDDHEFLAQQREAQKFSFMKDSKTLSWLYTSPHNPFHYDVVEARDAGKLVGFAIGRRMNLLGVDGYGITDIVTLPKHENALAPLAANLIVKALEIRPAVVAALVSRNGPAYIALRSLGFFTSPKSFSLIMRATVAEDTIDKRLFAQGCWEHLWGNNDTV